MWETIGTATKLIERTELPWFYVERDCNGTAHLTKLPGQLYRLGKVPPGVPDEIKPGEAEVEFIVSDPPIDIPQPNSRWLDGFCTNINSHPGGTREARVPEAAELIPATPPFRIDLR